MSNSLDSAEIIFPQNPINNPDIDTLINLDFSNDKTIFNNTTPDTNKFTDKSKFFNKMDINNTMKVKPKCFSGHDDVTQFLKQYEKAN